MKLLLFVYSLSSGGAQRVVTTLANHWAAADREIVLATLARRDRDFYALDPRVRRVALGLTAKSRGLADSAAQNLRRIVALRALLREERPDVAVAMITGANLLLALASFGRDMPPAVGSERIHPPRYPLPRPWEALRRHVYGRLAAVVALTGETARWLSAHTNARSIRVIPNAAVWPLPEHAPSLPPDAAVPPGGRLLLAVGRLCPQKGFDSLVAAFAPLSRAHPDWNLVVLGEGPSRAALEAEVAARGLRERISFPGRAGNLRTWYEAADLFVLSSAFEGFPNCLAEALAHGLPAVAFDCDTGPRDIVRHEVDGLLVPPGDVAALTGALDRLMADPASRRRLAARAVEARERFSIETIGRMWDEVFEEVRRPRHAPEPLPSFSGERSSGIPGDIQPS